MYLRHGTVLRFYRPRRAILRYGSIGPDAPAICLLATSRRAINMLLIWSPTLAEAIGPTTADKLPLANRAAFLFGDGGDCSHGFASKRKGPALRARVADGFVGSASSESAFSAAIALA